MLRSAAKPLLRQITAARVASQCQLPVRVNGIASQRVAQFLPAGTSVQSLRFYSAGGALSKVEVEGRITDLLKGFDKVSQERHSNEKKKKITLVYDIYTLAWIWRGTSSNFVFDGLLTVFFPIWILQVTDETKVTSIFTYLPTLIEIKKSSYCRDYYQSLCIADKYIFVRLSFWL